MAITTATSKVSNGQQKPVGRLGSFPAEKPALAARVNMPTEGAGPYWGDRCAFKIWLFCFLFMALMVAFNAITGLLRGSGGN
jgi:hypothetical protein